MKKMTVAFCAVIMGVLAAKADCFWSTWFDSDVKENASRGCVLGLASEVKTMSGAQVDVIMSKADKFNAGCQYAIGYSRVNELRNGCQLGFVNSADHAALQFGLVCINKGGFLPWFIFFNFDKTMFGAKK